MMIILSGAIGAGKSNLTKLLSEHLGTEAFFEPVETNPVLEKFYEDPQRYAFLLQIYFLNKRFAMIKKAMQNDNNVLDRSIYEDSLFLHMNADMGRVSKQEVDVYDELFENMMEELPYAAHKKAPDLLVHVHVDLATMLDHIRKRGRSYEQIEEDASLLDYYKTLLKYYVPWYEDYDASPKMIVDATKFDFVNNEEDRKTVLKSIDEKLLKLGKLTEAEYDQLMDKL